MESYADGKLWVPSRQDLESASLLAVLPPSAEEQRLNNIYLNQGLNALIEELRKF